MEKKKKALVLGATGLVGKCIVDELIADESIGSIVLFLRRSSGITNNKITEHIVDFENFASFKELISGDIAFSAMGTTLKQAGSKKAQYKVDYTYQYEFAKAAAENGVSEFHLVSSSGANAKSLIFYTKIKGQLDAAIGELPFKRTFIFRPSVLMGERAEKRQGEEQGAKIINGLVKWIPFLKKYRGIQAQEVAQSILAAHHSDNEKKYTIYTLDELFDLIQ